jgi:hypothetical protein
MFKALKIVLFRKKLLFCLGIDQDKQKILDIIVAKKRMVLVYSVNAIHKLK